MNAKQLLTLGAASLATLLCRGALAQEVSVNYVQVAEIEIESYEAAEHRYGDPPRTRGSGPVRRVGEG